jgi:hypothetical protein
MGRCMLVVVVASACASGCALEEVSGNLFARGGVLEEWALNPLFCISGEPEGFRGVDICGNDGCARLRLSPTEGPTVTVYEPHPVMPRVFSPAACGTFRATFERTPAYIENVRLVDGSFEIECDAEPRAVFGRIAFEGCH